MSTPSQPFPASRCARNPDPVLLDAPAVAVLLGVSERTVHILRRDATFPRAIQLGTRCVRWCRAEIEAWLAARPRQAEPNEPPQLRAARARRAATREGDAA